VADNARLYIAGAGNDVYIGGVSKEIASDVKGKSMDFDSIESLAQKRVMEVYDSHIAPARKAGDPGAPSMALLLAVQIKELEARLYRIEETGGIHLVDMGLAVVGTEAAETLVRGLASIFVMDYYTSVFTMHVIAII
jgi:hypothetical protein